MGPNLATGLQRRNDRDLGLGSYGQRGLWLPITELKELPLSVRGVFQTYGALPFLLRNIGGLILDILEAPTVGSLRDSQGLPPTTGRLPSQLLCLFLYHPRDPKHHPYIWLLL